MRPISRLPSKQVGIQNMVAQVEKMILRIRNKDFNDGVGEVRPPNEGLIKSAKSIHNRLNQNWQSLSGSTFSQETIAVTK